MRPASRSLSNWPLLDMVTFGQPTDSSMRLRISSTTIAHIATGGIFGRHYYLALDILAVDGVRACRRHASATLASGIFRPSGVCR